MIAAVRSTWVNEPSVIWAFRDKFDIYDVFLKILRLFSWFVKISTHGQKVVCKKCKASMRFLSKS